MTYTKYLPKFHVDAANVHKELRNYMLVDGYNLVFDLHSSSKAKIVDKQTGKEFIDFFTCFASMPIGFNHPKLLDIDFRDYLAGTATNKISNSDVYTEEMATFVKTFFEIAVPDYFKYSFFVEGGALAVENALKTAIDWKVRKNFRNGYKVERGQKIIHFHEAFHGRSGYTMSLTNTDLNKVMYFPKFDWPRVINPKLQFPLNDQNLEATIDLEKESIRQIEQAFEEHKDDIAAIIIEPIQGEGGDNHFRPEFFAELKKLSQENDALLIFDEIQTGVGLTGTMWAHEQMGVEPDILCFGKKMQVCGILVGNRLDEVDDHVFKKSSRINSTWGGNLVDMVRATKYLEIIEEENLVNNAKEMGNILMDHLKVLHSQYPNIISNVRGKGLFCAFDIEDPLRKEFVSKCYDNGLLILTCGQRSVRFRPPLNITEDKIDEGFKIISESIAAII